MDTTRRCGEPVRLPGVFTTVAHDTGHRCVRAAGHDGVHRWSARWEALPPAEVETEIAADLERWEGTEDDAEPDGGKT